MNVNSLWSVSLLSSILEGTDKFWDIIFIVSLDSLFGTSKISKGGFQESVLLWSNLLEDIGHHVLELFGLWGSGDNKEVFFNGELGCKKKS
jgi:hypothetical protein